VVKKIFSREISRALRMNFSASSKLYPPAMFCFFEEEQALLGVEIRK
jgi:hypothetical protein